MNAFQRMLWKEYRAWRTLWLGCVLGSIGLEIFSVVMALAVDPQASGWTGVLVGFAIAVPGIYILACTAATFAGEREEGTADWLTALAPPSGAVISAKLLFAGVSGIAMQAVLLLFAAAMSVADSTSGVREMTEFVQRDLPWMTLFVAVEALVWGTFWSLWSTHPLRTIVISAASIIAVNFIAAEFQAYPFNRYAGPVAGWAAAVGMGGWLRMLGTLAVLVVDVLLARRWLRGRYSLWPNATWSWQWPRLLRIARSRREASSAWRRAWQRFWWLELVHVRTYLLMSLGMSVVAAASLFFDREGQIAWAVLIGGWTLLHGGLAAWQGEQRRNYFRFFVDRGVSPVGLWANKLAIWLTSSLLATALLIAIVSGAWMLGTSMYGHTRFPKMFPLVGHFQNLEEMRLAFAAIAIYMVTATVVGFLCGQLFRRAVVAFGTALMGCVLLSGTLPFEVKLGFPLLWFALPIPLWLIWVSARQLARGWREQVRWPSHVSLAADFLVPVAVWFVALAAYRVYEVPYTDVPTKVDLNRVGYLLPLPENMEARAQWKQIVDSARTNTKLEQMLRDSPAKWSQILTETQFAKSLVFNEDAMRREAFADDIPTHAESMQRGLEQYDWTATAAQYPEQMEQLLVHLHAANVMAPEAAIWQKASLYHIRLILALFGEAAQQEVARGNGAASAAWLRAAMRLAGAASVYAPLERRQAISRELDAAVEFALLDWAQHPLQTDETLQQGLSACALEIRFWTVTNEDLIANYELMRRELLLNRFKERFGWAFWERRRALRIVNCEYWNQTAYLNYMSTGDRRASWDQISSFSGHEPFNAQWLFQDQFQRRGWDGRPVGLGPEILVNMFDRETRYRGMLAAAAVAGFERVHGVLPASLDDVAAYFGPVPGVLRDPWSGEDLRYQPGGFPKDISPIKTITETPVVWSVGPEHVQLQRTGGVGTSLRVSAPNYNIGQWDGHLRYVFPIPRKTSVEYVHRRAGNVSDRSLVFSASGEE